MTVDDRNFDSNIDEDPDPPILPFESYYHGDFVIDEGRQQARLWFLVAIETYKSTPGVLRPNEVIRRLRDDILPVFRKAHGEWIKLNPDVPEWKTGIPWLKQRDSPIFSALWSGIEWWARRFHLTFQNRPAEWVLECAHQNLAVWAMHSRPPTDLQWRWLDSSSSIPRSRVSG